MQQTPKLDTHALSRQLAVYGHEAQGKLMQLKVFICGINGLGLEIAKNLILAGPNQVTIHDPNTVTTSDLSKNFSISQEQISKIARSQASVKYLQQLNPGVLVDVAMEIDVEFMYRVFVFRVKNYSCVVVLDNYDKEFLVRFNKKARDNNVGFIYGGNLGLYGFVFVDFGQNHKVIDGTGEQSKPMHIAGITQEANGIVYLHQDKKHDLMDGDTVTFSEVKGMEEVNGKQFQINVRSPDSFTIGDTTKYGAYVSGGIAVQVKVPVFYNFNSLEDSLANPYAPDTQEMPICSWDKFGYPEQLHVILNGLLEFYSKNKRLPEILNKEDSAQLFKLSKEWQGKDFKVDQLNEKLVQNVSFYARTQISPMNSFWGGIITQQIIKLTGKYTPIRQWLHHEYFEVLPETEVPRTLSSTRYSDYVILFGDNFLKKCTELTPFVIGAGALGCEFIKMFALMGMSTSDKATFYCTDDDNIEISNLNRQFLFRREHVGMNKCQVACQAGKKINPSTRYQALKLKVAPENEDFFNDNFWNRLDIVVCAVDNVKARQYIDNQCVWYQKPLFESGTLGTKCHSQVIIPHATQSYNDIVDPPQQTIPLCTLKNFPYQIEHTIQWARQYFQGIIAQPSQDLKKFYENKNQFLDSVKKENKKNPSQCKQRLETLKKMYLANESRSYFKCVEIAVNIFWDVFHNQIAQLLHAFPQDHIVEQTKKPFWSGLKRAPKVLNLDLNDPIQIQLIQATSNILAFIFGLPMEQDQNVVRSLAQKVQPQKFTLKKIKIQTDQKQKNPEPQPNEQDEIVVENLYNELLSSTLTPTLTPTIVEFEKDDPTNWHIQFMGGVSNLRARNYQIQQADNFKIKLIAGKIIPAIATTTAMVVGAVGMQIIKYLLGKPIQTFKNVTCNLALPLWVYNDPLPPIEITDSQYDPIMAGPVKAVPSKFNKWKKIDIQGPGTVAQIKEKFQQEYQVEISMITYGTATVYSSFGKESKLRLQMDVCQAIQHATKKKIPEWRTIIPLGFSGNTEDGIDCIIPDIRYHR